MNDFNFYRHRHVPRVERWLDTDSPSFHLIAEPQRSWLALRTSLTKRLADRFGAEVTVRVLSERHDRFLTSERHLLETIARSGRIREVHLEIGGRPYVVARTVFPAQTARGANRELLHLGNRALGSLLFGAMRAPASLRQFICLYPSSSLWHVLRPQLPDNTQRLWARRAVHRLHGRPLLVTEIFLPSLFDSGSSEGAK